VTICRRRLSRAPDPQALFPRRCRIDALAAWRRAAEDLEEMEACFSLAQHYAEEGPLLEAFDFAKKTIERFRGPGMDARDAPIRRAAADTVVGIVRAVLELTPEPMGLIASWMHRVRPQKAVVNMSSVDLRAVRRWDRLVDLLASDSLVGARLTPDLPEERWTTLARLLESDEPLDGLVASLGRATETPARGLRTTPAKVGRNEPCSCGSRKKFKKCCGR
jgi:hypothetical protein